LKDSATHQLASWASSQRVQYKLLQQGKKLRMKEESIQMLNDIGFEWSRAPVDSWDERFEQLKAFQKERGHCHVPGTQNKDKAIHQLGAWVARQRVQYKLLQKGKNSPMKEERIQMLNDIGFEWSVPVVDWDERFKQLKAFQKEHGHCRVSGQKDKDSASHQLKCWVATQREQYKFLQQGKKSRMKEERIYKLNDIGFDWKLKIIL
jgi:RNase H-fold protein (predicted Holliday junction resolvase)